jgi:hypothetical protein
LIVSAAAENSASIRPARLLMSGMVQPSLISLGRS